MNVKFVRDLLYTLKKNYGVQATVAFLLSDTTDTKTGQRNVQRKLHNIRKAAVLPVEVARQVFYDLTFLKANNAFTYGGEVEIGSVFVLLDGRDLCQPLTLKENIFINSKRYIIHRLSDLQHNLGYAVLLKTVEGELPFAPIFVSVTSTLNLQGVTRDV